MLGVRTWRPQAPSLICEERHPDGHDPEAVEERRRWPRDGLGGDARHGARGNGPQRAEFPAVLFRIIGLRRVVNMLVGGQELLECLLLVNHWLHVGIGIM